jgi:hypothetical protein
VPTETEFVDYITDRDRIRVKFTLERGVPKTITVQLECEVGGRWWQTRRYDNFHGYVHVHTKPWDPTNDRTYPAPVGDIRHAITVVINDVLGSWQAVRRTLVEDLGRMHDDA